MHDRAHVTCRQSMLRQVRSQRYAIKFSNHPSRGYAVMKRGASPPVSMSQTVRTRSFRLDRANGGTTSDAKPEPCRWKIRTGRC
jgi:hypothetical protein